MVLKEVLGKIEELREDLSATTGVKICERESGYYEERGGHWEIDEIPSGGSRYGTWEGVREEKIWIPGERVWVSSVHSVYEPDIKKQERARKELLQLYQDSVWYSARYKARIALGVDYPASVSEVLLRKETLSPLVIATDEWLGQLKNEINSKQSRQKAKQDLKYFYKNLPRKRQRKKAGKLLGYSPLRILIHENQDTSAFVGLISFSGLGYLIYQYFSR